MRVGIPPGPLHQTEALNSGNRASWGRPTQEVRAAVSGDGIRPILGSDPQGGNKHLVKTMFQERTAEFLGMDFLL